MPTVRTGDIRGAYVGEREAGAMLMGNKIIWNRTALYTRTNNSAPAVPDWATFFTAILVGGGAGGQAGNGGVGSQGSGGRSGDVRFVSDSIHPGSSLSLVIGKGGSGGRSASLEYGRSGTSTTLSYLKYGSSSRSSTSAAGGTGITGNPTAGSPYITSGQGGRYYSSHRGGTSTMTIGSGGQGNAGTGTNGGGGAGGNGGFFNNYTPGGRGGDGWFQIQFYGVDPLAYQAYR